MGTQPSDVKTKEVSSSSSAADSVQRKSDASADSSTETGESSTSETQDVKSESLAEMVEKTVAQHNEKIGSEVDDQEDENEEGKSDSENESDKDKAEKEKVEGDKEDADDKKDDDKEKNEDEGEKDGEEKGPIPYERFQEVVAKRQEVEKQVKEYQPKAENFDRISRFCLDNNIAPEDFQKALELQALISKGDLPEATKRLSAVLEQIQGYTGDKLPADLQAKVDDGKIELDDAKEIATLRAKTKFGEASSKRTAESEAKRQQAEYSRSLENAAAQWETAKQAADPDYKPKAKESDVDGKWEDTRDKYLALIGQTDGQGNYVNPVRNAADMTALMERAYKAVNAKWSTRLSNRSATRKHLSSTTSSKTTHKKTVEEAETMQEAVALAIEARGR